MSFKSVNVVPLGKEATCSDESPISCLVCGKEVPKTEILSCPKCSCGRYCSSGCLANHNNHTEYCPWICDLQQLETEKRMKKEMFVTDTEKLPYKMKLQLVKLVGERPLVNVRLSGKEIQGLWDTGAMISLINEGLLHELFPGIKVYSIYDFTGENFTVTVANKSVMSVKGVVVFDFGVEGSEDLFQVPFLVTSQEMSSPIIGYNTIEHLVTNFKDKINLSESLTKVYSLSPEKVGSMVNLIEKGGEVSELTSEAKLERNQVVYPGCCEKVRCKINSSQFSANKLLVFLPLEEMCVESDLVVFDSTEILKPGRKFIEVMLYNPTRSRMNLKKGMLLGQVSDAAAAYTLPILQKQKSVAVNEVEVGEEVEDKRRLDQIDLDNLTPDQKKEVMELLTEEEEVFSKTKNDIGHIPDFKLDIKLTDETPFGEAYRKIPGNLYKEVKNHISDLLANGWIKQSYSPYSSPMVCVRKKDGGLRLCIDFRRLNKKTIPDMQPIPRITDILDRLHGQSWFTTLDMSQAYHQGELSEDARKYTGFSTPWALYEWVRIPYGIMNAPAGFQRFINNCLAHLSDDICCAYLDDILVYSASLEEHKVALKKVLRCLRMKGVKLNMMKCRFFKQEIRYLGRLISKDGYRPDPEDVKELERCKTPPNNVGKLRSLLGFLGYYRTYIKDFSRKVKPIYDLLQKDGVKGADSSKKQLDSKTKINWTDSHQKIVEEIVDYLKSPNVIAYPDFSKPFIVHTDASQDGLGAALYQEQEGKTKIISLASRTLTPAERNYFMHSGKLEFLALKWSVTEKFHDYLINGPDFEVVTDNNPLTYVLSTAKLHSTGLRWVAELASFRFSIRYRSGKKHVDADYLSRNAVDEFEELKKKTDKVLDIEETGIVLASAARKENVINAVRVDAVEMESTDQLGKISNEDLKKAQIEDEFVEPVYRIIEAGNQVTRKEMKQLSKNVKIMLKQAKKLSIVDGVLIRKTANFVQIVLLEMFRQLVYTELHEKLAHLGPDRVLELARRRFYWPRMKNDIENYVRKRCRCLISKKKNNPACAPMVPMYSTHPLELLTIDYMHLDKAKGGCEYVLVCCDHFTKFIQFYATKNKSGLAAADKVYNELVLKYGFPTRIHHDQGKDFNNKLFDRLHQLTGTKMSRTTPYHPQGNGLTERTNRTLQNMLKTLEKSEKNNWPKHLAKLSYAYNVTVNKTTGFSPYSLFFGREPRLAIDAMFELDLSNEGRIRKSYKEFAEDWKVAMNQAFDIVRKNTQAKGEYNKKHFEQKVRGVEINIGDRVLRRNREQGGTGKLRNHWHDVIYKVVAKDPDMPVVTIKPENGSGKELKVHRNNIMQCNELLSKENIAKPKQHTTEKPVQQKQEKQQKKQNKQQHQQKQQHIVKPVHESNQEKQQEQIQQLAGGKAVGYREDVTVRKDSGSSLSDDLVALVHDRCQEWIDETWESQQEVVSEEQVEETNHESETASEEQQGGSVNQESEVDEQMQFDYSHYESEPENDEPVVEEPHISSADSEQDSEDEAPRSRPKRRILPPIILSYDSPGKPANAYRSGAMRFGR